MRRKVRLVVLVALLSSYCNSDSGKQTVEVTNFFASSCKNNNTDTAIVDAGQTTTPCLAWRTRTQGVLELVLTNFSENCGIPVSLWGATANLNNDVLQLNVIWNFEYPNACGLCWQDYSLSVSSRQVTQVRKIEITTKACAGDCKAHQYLFSFNNSDLLTDGVSCIN